MLVLVLVLLVSRWVTVVGLVSNMSNGIGILLPAALDVVEACDCVFGALTLRTGGLSGGLFSSSL